MVGDGFGGFGMLLTGEAIGTGSPLLSSHPWDGQIPQANTDVHHLWQAAKD